MSLFKQGQFNLHSGGQSILKINCDTLNDEDWATVASIVAKQIKFRYAIGVPKGGLRFAEALNKYKDNTVAVRLIVDDVLTTGKSMEEMRAPLSYPTKGVVLFARGKCPEWITPVFQLSKVWRNI